MKKCYSVIFCKHSNSEAPWLPSRLEYVKRPVQDSGGTIKGVCSLAVNCADVAGVLAGFGPLVLEIDDRCTKICLIMCRW